MSALGDHLVERLTRCVIGLAFFGAGVAAIVRAELGLAPWDIFHQGVAQRTGLAIGTVIILTGMVLLLLWIPLRERPGIGTILNATEVGLVANLTLQMLPEMDRLDLRIALLTGGILSVGVGSALYIGSGLGAGPRDGLMTGLARRGLSIRTARTAIEVTALTLGVLLGGGIGVGTAAFALGIGPLVQRLLPIFAFGPPTARARRAPAQ